jgi:DNA-binding Lrp family transcriptional regulator
MMALQRWWTPQAKVSLAYRQIAEMTGLARKSINTSLKRLKARGLTLELRAAVLPRSMGSVRGTSALWDLPSRHEGDQPKVQMLPNLPRPEGKLTWNCGRLEADLRGLTGSSFKVLCYARTHRSSSNKSTAPQPSSFKLPIRETARLLNLSSGAVSNALKLLCETKRLMVVKRGIGRRPSSYQLAACYRGDERSFVPSSGAAAPMVVTGRFVDERYEGQLGAARVS